MFTAGLGSGRVTDHLGFVEVVLVCSCFVCLSIGTVQLACGDEAHISEGGGTPDEERGMWVHWGGGGGGGGGHSPAGMR